MEIYVSSAFPWSGNGNIVAFIPDADFVTIDTGASALADTTNTYSLPQATAGKQPAWSATSFNGNPGLTFDGTDDEMISTDAGLVALADGDDTDCTIILAANFTSTASGDQIVGFYNAGTAQYRLIRAGGVMRADRLTGNATFLSAFSGYQRIRVRFVQTATEQHLVVDDVADGNSPITLDVGSLSSTQFGIAPGSLGAGYPGLVLGGLAIVINDDTTVMDQFETFMAARMP